jgi:glutamine---fructose-6-phosphate transaminase (isomerizing)
MHLGVQFEREIFEQPKVLEDLLAQGSDGARAVAAEIRRFSPEVVLIAARGSSDNAARYAQYLFGAHNRLVVALGVPSLFTLYERPPRLERALVIGVSQSGQSPDIVAVVDEARRQGGLTLALTNDTTSPLATRAAHVLPLRAGVEQAVAATKTYSAELFLISMLSAALEDDPARWQELEATPATVQRAIDLNRDLSQLAEHYREARHFVVLARGFNYATAFEIALKMKETSYRVAEPYSIADLLHGPVAMIDRGFPALLIAPSGKTSEDARAVLANLRARGARIIAMSDDTELLGGVEDSLALPPAVPEWLSPLSSIVPGQLLALALARASGFDPDSPRGLSKVTLTL